MRQFQNYRAGVSTGGIDVNIFPVIELVPDELYKDVPGGGRGHF